MDLRVQFQHSESTFPTLIWPSNGPTNQDHLMGHLAMVRNPIPYHTQIMIPGEIQLITSRILR